MNVASDRAQRLARQPLREVNPPTGFFAGTVANWKAIIACHELLGELVKREIKSRYKDSGLGVVWSFIRPLVQLMVYYLVMGQFLGSSRAVPQFAVFIFTGLTLWGLFNEIVTQGTQSILSNSGIIKKVNVSREIFPLACVGSALFNFIFQFVLLIAGAVILPRIAGNRPMLNGGIPWGRSLLYLPAAILATVVWALALALIMSALNVYLRDVQFIVEVFLMLGFWFSPIIYQFHTVSIRLSHLVLEIYLANPVTVVILAFQRSIWGNPYWPAYETQAASTPPGELYPGHLALRLIVVIVVGFVVLFIGQRLFHRMQRNFAQEI